MLPAEFYLLLAIVSSTSVTIILRIFSFQKGNRYGLLLGNYLTCVIIAIGSTPDRSILLRPGMVTLVLGIIGGILFVAGLVFMQNSIRVNGASLTAAFARLGLIVPLLVSILRFGEQPRVHQLLGILLVFAAIFVLHQDEKSDGRGHMQLSGVLGLAGVLLVCGSGDTMIKIYEHTGQADAGSLFFFCLFGTAAIVTAILLLLEQRRTGQKAELSGLAAGIAVGIPNYFSSALLLPALTRLPAFIVYPCYSTGTILLVLLISRIFFHEKLTRRTACGLGIILAALVLLNIR